MDRCAQQSAGALDPRQSGVAAARFSRPRARAGDHGLLSLRRYRHLRHAVDHLHRLCDALLAFWHALQFGLHAADPQRTRGVGGDERRLLAHALTPRGPAAVETRAARRLYLRDDRLDPGAFELDPALLAGDRGGIDHDMGAVAEWSACTAFG